MILPGSTALVKTLGHKSDAIIDADNDSETTSLIGNFIPTAGIETNYWENSALFTGVAPGNLQRFNGIAHSTTDPDHFLLDGTNDYLGEAGGIDYGGDPLAIDGGTDPFTVAQWFKYNNVNHYIFYAGSGAPVGGNTGVAAAYIILEILTSNDQCKLSVRPSYNGDPTRLATATFDSFTFSDDTWYYVALTHDGADLYSVYVNGSFIGSLVTTYALSDSDTNNVEFGAKSIDMSHSYSGAGTKIGHIHVYTVALANSQVRQNFLATHDIDDNRIYGATYTG